MKRWPPPIAAILLLVACRPEAGRLLLLDLALSDPMLLESTARPWRDEGYEIEYRRFYPHLTWTDLTGYRTLILLGGSEPERASDRLSVGDLALLGEWLTRGGVVVFGYAGDGEGFADRWVMNRWLGWHGAGIVIGDFALRDTTRPPSGSADPQPPMAPRRPTPLHDPGIDPVPAGRNHVLLVKDQGQALARSSDAAFVRPTGKGPDPRPRATVVAASRVGTGLLVVASRHTLAASGPELRPATDPLIGGRGASSTTFLRSLARWTLRPAEWASIPPARGRDSLALSAAPVPVPNRPPRLTPPPQADTIAMLLAPVRATDQADTTPGARGAPRVPPWIARQGIRVFFGQLRSDTEYPTASARARELDPLIGFLEASGFVAVALEAPIASTGDPERFPEWQREYSSAVEKQLVERLQTSSLFWIPVIRPRDLRVRVESPARGIRGDSLGLWCALDETLWNSGLARAYRGVARLAAQHPELVPAVALDLTLPEGGGSYGMGYDYCDATYLAALSAMDLDSAGRGALAALPVERRYDALLEAGLAGAYYATLERLVRARATVLRRETRAFARDIVFGIRSAEPPGDWFTLGLLAGFADSTRPAVLWTRERRGRALRAALERRGIAVLHGTGISPDALGPAAWPRLRPLVFEESDGFWVAGERGDLRARTDSVARLIRRLSR